MVGWRGLEEGDALGGADDVLLEGSGGVVAADFLVEADAVVAFEAGGFGRGVGRQLDRMVLWG